MNEPDDRELAIRTIAAETSGDPRETLAIASTIGNRLLSGRWGSTPGDVVLARNQFEPWNKPGGSNDPMNISPDSPRYKQAAAAWDAVSSGQVQDPTNGATHFFAPAAQSALGRNVPAWARGQEGTQIGKTAFYAPEGRARPQPSAQIQWDDEAPSALGNGRPVNVPPGAPQSQAQKPVDGSQVQWDDAGAVAPPVPPASPAPSKNQVGAWESAVRGLGQGVTFGFGDEMAAAGAASPLPGAEAESKTTLGALSAPDVIAGAGRMMLERLAPSLFGRGGGQQYDKTLAEQRAANKDAQQANPITYGAGEIAGTIANPLARMAGPTLGSVAGNSALIGGLTGAGNAENMSAVPGAMATGAALGGALGAGAYGVLKGAGALAAPVSDRVRSAINGLRNPEDEAVRRVSGALARDAAAGDVPASADLIASIRAGQPVAVGDLGGETTRAVARSAANTSPEGRSALTQMTQDRYNAQSTRAGDFIGNLFRYNGDITATSEALQEAARKANRPLYEKAYKEGANGVWNDELANIANSPAVRSAISDAERRGANDAVAKGFERVRNPFTQDANGNFALKQQADGSIAYPSLAFWDQVKRGLDANIQALKRAGDPEAGVVQQLKSSLVKQLDSASPSYSQARGTAAAFFGAEDAIDAGRKFVQMNARPEDVRAALVKMNPAERTMFQQGFASKLVDDLRNLGDRANVMTKINQSPAAREKIEMALGDPQKYKELEAFLRVEGIMNNLKNSVQGNSTTARQLIEMGLAGGAVGLGTGDISKGGMAAGALFALRKGNTAIDMRVARKVADLLVSNDPAAMREVITRAAGNPKFSNAITTLDNALATISSSGGVAGAAISQ
jgi:Cell Wall Hydrolase